MQIVKYGDNLTVCLPAAIVEALALREGEQIELRTVGPRALEVHSSGNNLAADEKLRWRARCYVPEEILRAV